MDAQELKRHLDSNGVVTLNSVDLKPMIEELISRRAAALEILEENNKLKIRIEEYELAIERGIQQLRESMREIYVKMNDGHELLRKIRKLPHVGPEIHIMIDELLKRDGLLEDESENLQS